MGCHVASMGCGLRVHGKMGFVAFPGFQATVPGIVNSIAFRHHVRVHILEHFCFSSEFAMLGCVYRQTHIPYQHCDVGQYLAQQTHSVTKLWTQIQIVCTVALTLICSLVSLLFVLFHCSTSDSHHPCCIYLLVAFSSSLIHSSSYVISLRVRLWLKNERKLIARCAVVNDIDSIFFLLARSHVFEKAA